MDAYDAPRIDRLAAAPYAGRVVASVAAKGFSTQDLEEIGPEADLEWSLDPEPEPVVAAEPAPARRRIGWLAPLVFLFGLFVAGVAAVTAFFAALVVGLVAALYLMLPGAPSTSEAEFILVPDTLPVQELPADEADAEFILVPDTLPVQGEAPKATAPSRKARPAKPAKPAKPAPSVQEASPAPTAPAQGTGSSTKVSLEAVPLDEAVRRVKGKAGRGEARSARGH